MLVETRSFHIVDQTDLSSEIWETDTLDEGLKLVAWVCLAIEEYARDWTPFHCEWSRTSSSTNS